MASLIAPGIRRGSRRTVVLLPWCAVKIGVHPLRCVRSAWGVIQWASRMIRTPYVRTLRLLWRAARYEVFLMRSALAAGRRERRLTRTILRAAIAPTHWSLGGVITIAARAAALPPEDPRAMVRIAAARDRTVMLWERLHPEAVTGTVLSAAYSDLLHTFDDEENFGIRDGRIVLLDYGAAAFEELYRAAPNDLLWCLESFRQW